MVITFLYSFFNGVIYFEEFYLFIIDNNKIYKLIKVIYRLK